MTKDNLTIIDSFIHLCFNDVYNEIRFGCENQDRDYFIELKKTNSLIEIPFWKKEALEIDVLEAINLFFYLCLNASKFGKMYEEIEEWILAFAKVCCSQRSHGVVSAYKYRVLINSSEQITNFIFGCFNWGISKENVEKTAKYKKKVTPNDSFDDRISFYKKSLEKNDQTPNLLYAMKELRNSASHDAYKFYVNREEAFNKLRCLLYDYITIFYMIKHHTLLFDKNGLPLRGQHPDIIKERMDALGEIEDWRHVIVSVECNEGGQLVPERIKDLRLSLQGSEDYLNPVDSGHLDSFMLERFSTYEISIVTDGIISDPSEPFMIDQGYVNGSLIRVDIPPKGSMPTPEKVSIRELILYREQDLPDDVLFILEEMDHYPSQYSEFVKLARALVLASATNNEKDKKVFEEAVRHIREKLEKEYRNDAIITISQRLQADIDSLYKNISSAYEGKQDFVELCDAIDGFYDSLSFLKASGDKGKTATQQIQEAVKNILEGKKNSIGTKSTEEAINALLENTKLEVILSMRDKYPEIIEAELGAFWLDNEIDDLYIKQISQNVDEIYPLWENVDKYYSQIMNTTALQGNEKKATLEYATLLRDILNDTPDISMRVVSLFSETLLFWLKSCQPVDDETDRIKEKCKDIILNLRENRSIQVSLIPVNDEEARELREQHILFKGYINALDKQIESYRNRFEKLNNDICPIESRDVLSEVRFKSISQIVNSYGSDSFMQFFCCSTNCSRMLGWLLECSSLGISPNGLFGAWSGEYHTWEEENKLILEKCRIIKRDIVFKYFNRKRRRVGDDYYSTASEADDMKASRIMDHLKMQLEQNYKGNVPDYIVDIRDASETKLSCQAKIKLLQSVVMPSSNPFQNLILLVNGVIDYWGVANSSSESLLRKYIFEDYAKRIMSDDAINNFSNLDDSVKRIYIKTLLCKYHLGAVANSIRYMLAFRLNISNGEDKAYIPMHEMIADLAKFHQASFYYFDLEEVQSAITIISIVAEYSQHYPDEKELNDLSRSQREEFMQTCQDYLGKHLKTTLVEDGKRPDWKYGYLRKELKGKSDIDRLVEKYVGLYTENYHDYIIKKPSTSIKYKSGWCAVEKELFDNIIKLLPQEDALHQNEICNKIFHYLTSTTKDGLPFYDVRATHIFELKQFCSQQNYDKVLNSFYGNCICFCVNIINPSVIDGLFTIRQLFEKYGQNVKTMFDVLPTTFVDILILLYKFVESNQNTLEKI